MAKKPEKTQNRPASARRRISDGLRADILAGRLKPGSRLPTTKRLAEIWKCSAFTAHTALHQLAKEGWVDRLHGSGTHAADPRRRFRCAGIYYDSPVGGDNVSSFARNLHFAVVAELERAGKKFEIFADPRPEPEQKVLLPDVAKAVYERRIQCLISTRVNFTNRDALFRVGVPVVFLGSHWPPLRKGRSKEISSVDFDLDQFLSEGLKQLVLRGCRSVGIISSLWHSGDPKGLAPRFHHQFRRMTREAGLATRPEWVREPAEQIHDLEKHGYDDFTRLWKLREKPDALFVYPDPVARGAILAALELGAHRSVRPIEFVFHQNAQQKYFCPFPATFGISDEDRLAREMVLQLQRQFDGENPGLVKVPYRFIRGEF